MSKYTTGEIARLCEVSVRTVQYYDTRGILIPSELSEGGRRIYNDEDLKKMKAICFLRELDLPINSIKELLSEEHPETVISLMLEEQEKVLRAEIAERQERYLKLEALRRSLKKVERFSVESIGDIAHIMTNRKKLRRLRTRLLVIGAVMDIAEIGTLALWITKGYWLPFAVVLCAIVAVAGMTTVTYHRQTAYICPECHTVFRPTLKQFLLSKHTPSARKLTCTACGHNGFCVETYELRKGDNS